MYLNYMFMFGFCLKQASKIFNQFPVISLSKTIFRRNSNKLKLLEYNVRKQKRVF